MRYNLKPSGLKPSGRLLTAAFAAAMAFSPIAAVAQEVTLRLAHVVKEGDPAYIGAETFRERVAALSDGRIAVKIFPAGQLGNNRKLFAQVQSGAVDMSFTPFNMLADIVPEFSIVTGGYMFESPEHQQRLLESAEFGQAWAGELLEKGNLRILSHFFYGTRNLTTAKVEVRSPEGLSGLKIRAVPNSMSLATVRGLGAAPTPVAWPETFQALRQGIVDGQENPIPVLYAAGFYEVQKYLIKTQHQMSALPFLIREPSWAKLSAADQQVLRQAATEAAAVATKTMVEFTQTLEADLVAKGMTIVELTEAERAVFRDRVRASVAEEFDGKVFPAGLIAKVHALAGG
ncbi:TRAP transporter substrate-binding protein [Pelagibius litoralis]|uniref:TRAP transporter substrate-binding protein n=1 Tax=Pelagibius litoralis TaxID=374515 RepID=A0A967EWX9_9PROT|nr:TRAP transporter substrate-binding protein [Pelagibius litoralis]NIA68883.1 TRAP transporter substrate-binding protein [Pelagibius litoralis]